MQFPTQEELLERLPVINLKIDIEYELFKDWWRPTTIKYLGFSEDGKNLQFEVYKRKGLRKTTEVVDVLIGDLESTIYLNAPPYRLKIKNFDENSVDWSIVG